MPLLAARHAPAAAPGRCYGRIDEPVDRPPERAAEQIAAQLDRPPDLVWSSPSARCRDPAALLARRVGAPHRIDPRLHELDFGAWEGEPWTELERRDGARLRAWADDWQHSAPPGGESAVALQARVHAWLAGLSPFATHLLVGHAGVLRALSVLLEGRAWPEAMAAPVPHLELRRFDLRPLAP